MIKRLLGIVVTLAAIVIIVLASLGMGSYKSMVFEGQGEKPRTAVPAPKPAPALDTKSTPAADSTDTVR